MTKSSGARRGSPTAGAGSGVASNVRLAEYSLSGAGPATGSCFARLACNGRGADTRLAEREAGIPGFYRDLHNLVTPVPPLGKAMQLVPGTSGVNERGDTTPSL